MTNTTWLALILSAALPACSGAAPQGFEAEAIERTETTAPEGSQAVVPEEGPSPTGKSAYGSVEATDDAEEQDTPAAEETEPAPEEQEPEAAVDELPADELPEAVVVNSEDAADAADPTVAMLPDDGQMIDEVIDDGLIEEPTVDVGAPDVGGSNDSMIDTGGTVNYCEGATNGVYCAVSLDASLDPKALIYCRAGAELSEGECAGPCDPKSNTCQNSAGSSEGSADASDLDNPCPGCLAQSCGAERKACKGDPLCSAQWPCLTTCANEDCEAECNMEFALAGDDGQMRSCAEQRCSKECSVP